MSDKFILFTYFNYIYCLFVVSYVSATNLENANSINSILSDIIEKNNNDEVHQQLIRRQLNIGNEESWTGRWFPDKVSQRPPHTSYGDIVAEGLSGNRVSSGSSSFRSEATYQKQLDDNNMWKMINSSCDDGKTNLTVDWSGSPINYTCLIPHDYFRPDYSVPSIVIKSIIPKAYRAKHECMQKEIHYSLDIPTFGTHRPAWPRYGEYLFLPRQRWIHSLEHGAIVMLYHPCAHPQLVKELRELVTGCLRRHIITPYTLLPKDRPLALLSWGWAFLMSTPDEVGVTSFIKNHALRGPEVVSRDGQFSERLIKAAKQVTDVEDSTLCPEIMF